MLSTSSGDFTKKDLLALLDIASSSMCEEAEKLHKCSLPLDERYRIAENIQSLAFKYQRIKSAIEEEEEDE